MNDHNAVGEVVQGAASSGTTASSSLLDSVIDAAVTTGIESVENSIDRDSFSGRFDNNLRKDQQSQNGHIEFGPYSGNSDIPQHGYQLTINTEHNQIKLLRINSRGSSVIESIRKNISINQPHIFEWIKEDSLMTLAMDGEQLLQVDERSYQNDFTGFMLNNYSGAMTMHDIMIMGN